jgi:hypothetical protein
VIINGDIYTKGSIYATKRNAPLKKKTRRMVKPNQKKRRRRRKRKSL